MILVCYAGNDFAPHRSNGGDKNHVRTFVIAFKVNTGVFLQDRRGKRTKVLSELDIRVNKITHFRLSRIGQNASMPERPGTELSAVLEPPYNLAIRKQLSRFNDIIFVCRIY